MPRLSRRPNRHSIVSRRCGRAPALLPRTHTHIHTHPPPPRLVSCRAPARARLPTVDCAPSFVGASRAQMSRDSRCWRVARQLANARRAATLSPALCGGVQPCAHRAVGLLPDMLVCRTSIPLEPETRAKIAMYCHVPERNVLAVTDVSNIFHVPLLLQQQASSIGERQGENSEARGRGEGVSKPRGVEGRGGGGQCLLGRLFGGRRQRGANHDSARRVLSFPSAATGRRRCNPKHAFAVTAPGHTGARGMATNGVPY